MRWFHRLSKNLWTSVNGAFVKPKKKTLGRLSREIGIYLYILKIVCITHQLQGYRFPLLKVLYHCAPKPDFLLHFAFFSYYQQFIILSFLVMLSF